MEKPANEVSSGGSTRDALLRAAKKVFAHRGYDGATVKELAEEAGVNVSLVSYHFGGKEGLYRACLEEFGRDRLVAFERILKAPSSLEDFRVKLRLYGSEFLRAHVDEPEVSTILQRACADDLKITHDIFISTFVKGFLVLVGFIESAVKNGLLRRDLDPKLAAMMFMGGVVHSLKVDGMVRSIPELAKLGAKRLEDENYREKLIEEFLGIFLDGVTSVPAREARDKRG